MRKSVENLIKNDCQKVLSHYPSEFLKKLKNQCILITGGTGFIGTWLVELLTFLNDKEEYNVKLILLSERAYDFGLKAPHLVNRRDITLLTKDIAGVIDLPAEITMIIHAAGSPDNRLHASDPLKVMRTITMGTEALLSSASRLPNLSKILNISSGLIYGSRNTDSREFNSCGQESFSFNNAYIEAKRYAETLCSVYGNQYKLNIINIRPYAFVGPYQLVDRPWAINNFIGDYLNDCPIRILGDGETVRSYMYPSDMSLWILKLLADGHAGQSYNLGNPTSITLKSLAEKIASTMHKKLPVHVKYYQDHSLRNSRFVPDVSKAHNELGLKVTVEIDEALEHTLLWNLSQYNSVKN